MVTSWRHICPCARPSCCARVNQSLVSSCLAVSLSRVASGTFTGCQATNSGVMNSQIGFPTQSIGETSERGWPNASRLVLLCALCEAVQGELSERLDTSRQRKAAWQAVHEKQAGLYLKSANLSSNMGCETWGRIRKRMEMLESCKAPQLTSIGAL